MKRTLPAAPAVALCAAAAALAPAPAAAQQYYYTRPHYTQQQYHAQQQQQRAAAAVLRGRVDGPDALANLGNLLRRRQAGVPLTQQEVRGVRARGMINDLNNRLTSVWLQPECNYSFNGCR